MNEKLNVLPSIERLCDTVMRYARNMKGIVYAIDIKHAEHIAEYYREHGLNAVAISSKTPKEERKRIIERFRNTNCQDLFNDSNTNCHELSMNYSTNYSTNCQELASLRAERNTQHSTLNTQHSTLPPATTQHSTLNIQHFN